MVSIKSVSLSKRKDLTRCLPKIQSRTTEGIAILLAFVVIHLHAIDTPYSKMAANKLFFCLHVN